MAAKKATVRAGKVVTDPNKVGKEAKAAKAVEVLDAVQPNHSHLHSGRRLRNS